MRITVRGSDFSIVPADELPDLVPKDRQIRFSIIRALFRENFPNIFFNIRSGSQTNPALRFNVCVSLPEDRFNGSFGRLKGTPPRMVYVSSEGLGAK